uniref:Uncharacterized protein n=1 Tax=Melanopsichium pennsylvanicum 4 TaxID=1398559 RepID=A0A077R458_9BASI|nr:uncharacterized protein BN887_06033 [Melanopsichium pennsylvanicum 4]
MTDHCIEAPFEGMDRRQADRQDRLDGRAVMPNEIVGRASKKSGWSDWDDSPARRLKD